ncbi:MAG: hypothetical protein HDS62_02120 [Bacteroidales bacterium]|nr:hypothetical protein [Bacteroidales bacterium]
MAQDKVKSLYDTFVKEGYNMESEAEFRKNLADPAKRKAAYEALKKDGYQMEAYDVFETNIGYGKAPTTPPPAPKTAVAPKPQAHVKTASAPAATKPQPTTTSAPAPQATKPTQPTWKPSEQDKIRMSWGRFNMLNDFREQSQARVEQAKRATMPMTKEGRKKLKSGKFQAQLAGTLTKMMGLTPNVRTAEAATEGESQEAANNEPKPIESAQSPVPYGVRYVNGRPVTEWMLPDGSLTTDLVEADKAEYGARTVRLRNRFVDRMKENGLDPTKQEDVQKQSQIDAETEEAKFIERTSEDANNVVAELWQEAEEKLKADKNANADKIYGGSFPVMGRENRVVATAARDQADEVSHMTRFDLEKMMKTTWVRVGNRVTAQCYNRLRTQYPQATEEELQKAATDMARGLTDNAVYQYAVKQNTPKSTLEYFGRNVADANVLNSISKGLARSQAGTSGDLAAYEQAMGEYGKNHRVAQIGGTVAGMAIDPVTYISGGMGSLFGKGAMWAGGRFLASRAAGMSTQVGTRLFSSSLSGRLLTGAAAGAGNFMTFETLKEAENQFLHGGHINEQGENEGYSAQALLKSAGKGFLLGGVTGTMTPLLGNVTDKAVKATESTAGKVGLRATELGVSTIAEGTVFALPEWYENSKREEGDPNKRTNMDIWTDNLAMMLGFKVSHGIKSAPRVIASLRPIKPADGRPLTQAERNHNRMSFEERVRKALDPANPNNLTRVDDAGRVAQAMRFTADEREELRRAGYGELADIFSRDREQTISQPNPSDGAIEPLAERVEAEEIRNGNPEFDGYSDMEKLMQDGRVSQAARAKAYYVLTGRMLPMGTVTGWSKDKAEDGRVTINAVTADGEVVTSRTFANEKAAEKETNNISRQAELNSVDVGERYREALADEMLLEEAISQVSPGADKETVKRIYRAVKAGNKDMTEDQAALAGLIDEAIERNKDMADRHRPEAIRAELREESGIEVDDALRKTPDKRTAKEKEIVQTYLERLFPEEARERAEEPTPEQQEAQGLYEEGKLLYGRYEEGDPNVTAEVDAIVIRMQEANQLFEDTFGAESEYYRFHLNENPWELINDPELTAEQQDAVLYYINAKAALDGVMDASHEAADRKRVDVERSVAKRTHKETGAITPATMKVNDRQVYIVKGDVAMYPDGSGVDAHNSSESIVVMDADSGEYEFTSPDQIFSVGENIDPEDEMRTALEAIEQERDAIFGENGVPPAEEPEETPPPMDGNNGDENIPENGNIDAENIPTKGSNYAENVQQIADTEKYDQGYEDGITSAQEYSDERLNDEIEKLRGYGDTLTDFGRGMLEAMEYAQQERGMAAESVPENRESVPNIGENSEIPTENRELVTENVPKSANSVENVQETALSRIPLHEETGEPMFEAVEKELAWDGLVETVGTDKDAADIALAQIEQANEELEALKKKPPTMKAPKLKGTPMAMAKAKKDAEAKYEKELAEYNQRLADTQAKANAWTSILGVHRDRATELRRQQEEERRQRDAELHDQAVAQFEEEQRLKAERDAEQAAIGAHAVNPKIKEKWDSANKVEGNPDAITLPDGSTIRGRYVLTEAGAASASHDVNNAYEPTEGFPIDANGQSVNDRDYLRDKDAQRIVGQIAGAYDSRAMQTPVIVSQDGVVLSGNNRTMSGDLAARQGTDKAYVDYLREFGAKYGFTPEQVNDMEHPRLVFVPDEALPYDASTFSRFNAQDMKSQSKPEAAVKLGKIVPDNVFENIVTDIAKYDRLSDYYKNEEETAHALGALMQAGVINDKQMPEMRTGTALSAAGKELIENTLIGKVFQSSPDAVRQIISMPTLRQPIVMGLNEIANNRTLARNGYDLSEELSRAVDLVTRAKAAMPDVYTEGMPVSPFGREQGLFDDEYGDSRVTDATTLLLADMLNSGKPGELRKVLATYNNEASQSANGQMDLFTGKIPTKEEILTNVNSTFNNGTAKEKQQLVDAAIAARKERAAGIQELGGSEGVEQVEYAGERGEGSEERAGGEQTTETDPLSEETQVIHVDPRRMSDEEKSRRGEMLHNAEAISVEKGMITSRDGKSGRKVAEEWWDNHVGKAIFYDTEAGEVGIDKTSVKDSLSHGYSQEKLDAIASLADGFQNATYLGSIDDFKRPGVKNHYFAYPIEYDGQRKYVFCRAMESNNKNRLYVHEVFMEDTIKRSDSLQTIASASKDGELHGGIALYKAILANILGASAKNGSQQRKERPVLWEKGADSTPETVATPTVTTIKAQQGDEHMGNTEGQGTGELKTVEPLPAVEASPVAADVEVQEQGDSPMSGDSSSIVSGSKGNTLLSEKQGKGTESSDGYTITPTQYQSKKKKEPTPVWVVKFDRDLSYEEKKALVAFMKEPLTEGKKTSRGWLDKESGQFYMRSEEAAKGLASMLGNEEAVADAQPLTAEELREAVTPYDKPKEKKPAKPKKAPINRVSLEDVMTDLSAKGETKLSDHSEPVSPEERAVTPEEKPAGAVEKAASRGQFKVTDEMKAQEDELRRLLGIDDEEGSRDVYFRDPDELTPEEKRKVFAIGVNYAFNFLDNGVTSFPDFAKGVVGRLGSKVKPFLKSWYEGAKRVPGYGGEGYTETAEVDRFDVENFDKPSYDAIKDAEMRVAERKAQRAAAQAEKEIKETRNKQRKENEKQREADTVAIAEKGETVAGKAESLAETSGDERELNRVSEEIDTTIEEINDQLAILGYFERKGNDPVAIAERKAAGAGADLAARLVEDLGLKLADLPKGVNVVGADFGEKGGYVRINLPVRNGYEPMRIDIRFDRTNNGSLRLTELMTTLKRGDEESYIKGKDHKVWLSAPTYGELVNTIKEQIGEYQPKEESFEVPAFWHDKSITELEKKLADIQPKAKSKMGKSFGMDKIAEGLSRYIERRKAQETPKAELQEEAYHGTVTLKDGREAVVIVANHTETMGEPARLTDYIVGVKGEPGTIKISPEEIAHAGAPTAEDIPSHAKEEESHNGYKRGDEVMWDRYGNGKWEKVKIEDFDADGSPIFESVKGIMSEKGDWSRVKPADGVFGEAKRVATKAQVERKKKAETSKGSERKDAIELSSWREQLRDGEGKKTSKKKEIKPEQPVGDLFGGLFDEEPISDEKKTDVQSRAGASEREGGHEPQPNEPLGTSQRNEVKGSDGRGMGGRDNDNPMSDGERGTSVSRQSKRERKPLERAVEGERRNVRNNHAERGVDYAPKGEDARIKANIEAIELAKRLLDAGETATPEQMAVLRKFSGWGGLGKAFNESVYNPTAKKLHDLLGEEGYKDAVMSRNSAYYTPAPVIDAMWDVVKALGFTGGNVLEGSAGIGNILGLMPMELSDRSRIHAVEIDRTTGGILSLLYPDAKVDIQGFEKTKVRNGSIDLAITNVPFVSGLRIKDETGDKDLSKKFHDIHDFCIAKNIRKLRDGGIGIFISSSGTMDNSKELRKWIINEGNADVVGAFRLHNKTFGGTGATSDIIVVRKRVNGKKSPNAIDVTDVTGVRVAEYDTGETKKVKGKVIPIVKQLSMYYNKYFAEHPENMAGEMRFGFEEGDSYRPKSRALYPVKGKDQSTMLNEWTKRFSEMEEEAIATPKIEDEVTRINEKLGEGVKEGSMVLNFQGELCMARMGEAVPLGLNKNKVKGHTKSECFKAYTAIKKALSDVLEYQANNDDNAGLDPLLKELNRAFDTFTRTYGNLHKNPAISFLRNDVDFSSILALETYSEKGDKNGNKVVKTGKTDIFSRRVIETEKEPQPTTIKDGILASLYKSGNVDVDYIAQALGKTTDEVKREIVESGLGFENPSTTSMEVSYKYLSGNVREKLQIAQENNEDGRYDANIKALEKVMPMTIPAHLIEFSLGSSWIEPKLYEDFVYDKTGVRVKLTNAGGTWFMKTPWNTFNEKNRAMAVHSQMCDKTIMGHELIEAAITNKQITVSKQVKHSDNTTETITDKVATAQCSAKVDEIRAEFKDWARDHMQKDPEMSARIEQTYNEQFNNYVPMSIPEEFVPKHFGGQVSELHGRPFALRSHQGKAVVRGTTEPILLAHEVGTGKTYTLITTAMEMRRLGTARKPMIVVQNATVGQFVESAKEIYPNAKVLTIEEADRTAEGRRNFYAKIKYNDWDMIVVPQSVFEKIPDSEEREMAYVKDIIEEKMKVLEAMREADTDGRSSIVREAEKELAKQEERLAELTEALQGKKKKKDEKKEATTRQNAEVRALEMLDRETDDVENFDDMGIDALLVDEAHEYKHLGFATAIKRGVKGVDPSYSKKSQGVFLKTQAVMERNNGRNVIFATGTPISNTAAEIWTFMRYLMPADTMKAYDIYYFDDFVRNFGNIAQMVEFKTNGKFDEVSRFAGYVNLPELVRIWSSVADTVLTREAGGVSDKIPEMEGGKPQDIYLPQTPALRSVMKFVKEHLEAFEKMSGREKRENRHIPLDMYRIAKAAAVDVRLVMDAEDNPNSKTNAAVRETLRSLKDSEKYRGTVAIFADNYQNKNTGFNLYDEIRNKLIAQGVPADQIVIIRPGMTIKKKLDIFEKVNAGEIRVVLGSTYTLGTGVNIQERLYLAIHVDAPNRPMDYTQRNGRILRQGNLHKDMGIPVRVIRFGVEDSLDVTAYQRLKTKGAIADSIMNGTKMMANSMENRVLEEEEDSFGDMTAQLSGSEYAILKNQAEREVRGLTAKLKGHETDQIYIHNKLPEVEKFIKGAEWRIERESKNLELINKHWSDGTIKKVTVGKLSFNSVEAMEDFFKEQNAKMKEAEEKASAGGEAITSKLTINVDGVDFEVTTTVSREIEKSGQATLGFELNRSVTYSCEPLGIKDVQPKGNRVKNVMQEIAEQIANGTKSRKLLHGAQHQLEHYREEKRQLEERSGKEFPYKKELAEAKKRLEQYEEAMKKELAEKEAKYAELDKSVEAATDVTLSDEDGEDNTPTNREGNKYRDGEEMSDGERLRAIRALEPIEIERNDMSRAELREVYNNLPSVEKEGREIEFYHSAFKKIYKEGGLFGQVVPVLDEVLEQSVLAYSDGDNLGGIIRPDGTEHKEHKNVLRFDNYVGKVSIDGTSYFVRTTVQHEMGQAGTHSFFVSNVDVYENPTESRTIPITSRGTTDFDGIVDAKLQQFFERASSEATKLDMRERVEELSEKLHTPVRIVSDETELSELSEEGKPRYSRRERRAKGWWSSRTGEVVVVLPNNVNVADVENTVVHEIVGHKGLRAFIGEERFDDFLREVYDHASDSIRKRIDALTDRMVNEEADRLRERKRKAHERAGEDYNSTYYTDMAEARVEAEKKREEYRREATEEYMADLGGRIGDEGFTKMAQDELTLWGKIKAKVQQFLDKFLKGLKIAKSIRLSDKDLSYILFKSWKNASEAKTGHGDVFMDAEGVLRSEGTRFSLPKEHDLMEVRKEAVADRIEELFNQAVSGNLKGKPVEVGRLTEAGRRYLEKLSGIKLKENVRFMLNPSDLQHINRRHYGENERDGRNIPLNKEDIRAIADVINNPDKVMFGKETAGDKRNMFFFLKDVGNGSYNLLEVYANSWGNLTSKSFFKSKESVSQRAVSLKNESSHLTSVTDGPTLSDNEKAVSQRVLSLMKSEHLTSVTDGASLLDGAKLPKFFEYPKSEGEEDKIFFRDLGLGLEETITKMKAEAMQANADNLQAKREAMRAIGGNLNHLRRAMARQREYDITTVKSVSDLARILMENGLLDDLSKYETKRILSAIKNAVGKEDVSRYVQKVMDIMVDNQLRMGANTLGRLMSIRGNRVDARGIEVQGALDPEGQRIAQVVRKSTTLPKDDIDNRLAEAMNRMSSNDQAIAEEATIEYAGLTIARQYVEEITESKAEEKALCDSIKQGKEEKEAGQMTEAAYRQMVEATEEAIRQNKIERAESFYALAEQLGGVLNGSIERAKQWREAEKKRIEEIHHNTNSDMQGRPSDEHHKDSRAQKIANNSAVRFLLAPLATFDQMLRMFGGKSVRGEGYLWNRYMRGWVEAAEKEYTGYRDALKTLDAKVSEIFDPGRARGGDSSARVKVKSFGDLFTLDRKLPRGTVKFWDGGEMKEHELTQGNLLYIYMADKMSDGRMKLRRMGITSEDVEEIRNFLDPRFIELADWMQEEFLVEKRNEYNEVHKRMFGASMAAIDNYFPLKILANARLENVDVADDTTDTALPATSTGSIIKRRRNNLALDVTGANAFSVILDHLQEMERWAAFAEFNRDLNTLLSYKRFRNQVMNMTSAYGAGKTLWNNFRNVCSMAAGTYRPPIAALDKAAVNIAKGVTAAKVSFRVFTALKQFLSMPAYASDSNPLYLAANIANPVGAWRWSMENLPLFEKRWKSRMAGDPRLLKSDMDWKMWRSRIVELASRVGMSPNAFVDALTVAIGTHAMYQTKKAKYLRWGMDEEAAEKRAKQDATILFNQTQQSSEGAFLSTMQVDRSWLSVLFTVFRNSSMSYTRQLYDAMRNLGHRMTPGYKDMSHEYMAKQMRRDGIDPDTADREAKREYRRGIIRDLVRVGIFGAALQLAWNLGAYLPYILLGDDEEEKNKMWDDVWMHTMFGSVEGLTGGDVMSAAGNMWASGEGNPAYLTKDMPLAADVLNILKKWDKDQTGAMNDVINLLVQSGLGVNPQSLTDATIAVMDFCGDDAQSARECALLITRILNCPQSQIDKIYFDELNATGEEASRMTPKEIAERFARYKVRRGAPLTGWAYGNETRETLMNKYRDRSNKLAKERIGRETDRQAGVNVSDALAEYETTKARVSEVNKVRKQDEERYYELLDTLENSPEFERYLIVGDYKREVEDLTKQWLRAKTTEERDSIAQSIVALKREMLKEVSESQ